MLALHQFLDTPTLVTAAMVCRGTTELDSRLRHEMRTNPVFIWLIRAGWDGRSPTSSPVMKLLFHKAATDGQMEVIKYLHGNQRSV